MEKDLKGLEGPKAKIHRDLVRATLRKYQIVKRQTMIAFMDTGLKNYFNSRETEMNRCLQETAIHECITKGKTTMIQKDPQKGTALNHVRIHNVPTDDEEN